ncbi:MAG: J domain-containing protein, partial [Mariniblastus sp.]|nr:J domain-containing protein [Mariniblastus sp.]
MKKQKNPFYRWLGIRSTRPHHYKLLGVPRSADTKQIQLAAQARLERLRSAETDDDESGLNQVKDAVEKAIVVLSDPERRKAYDLKLEAAAQKRAEPPTDPPSPSSGGGQTYTQDDLLPPKTSQPTEGAADEADPDVAGRDQGSDESPVAVAQPVEVKPEGHIPLAVPLQAAAAEPESSPSSQGEDGSSGADPLRGEAHDYEQFSQSRKKGPSSGKFRIRSRGGRRGKRSLMVPLVSMFFFVVGIAGLLYFLFAYLEMNGGAPMTADGSNVTADGGQGDLDGADQADGLDEEDGTGKQPIVPQPDDGEEGGRPAMEPDHDDDSKTDDTETDDTETDDTETDDTETDDPETDDTETDDPGTDDAG